MYLPQMVESGGEILLIMIRDGPKPQLPDPFLSSLKEGQENGDAITRYFHERWNRNEIGP